ncbi:MAG: Crp/Fnr family transcriptional regulator [Bradyrhizobium sp.]|uniref:Crp/Fnr family transcriptional regulator n=1 Tax=Bradyrhizobium sp. TaxID=376 RepID=UPI0025C0E0BC|nr:Crp/Fnr family transcriptional regulator [Bradyrhizobium sp.]MBI5261072.1 Crp/Fnr family transcriptional regulator [Bradyrhizobium sp.]
MHTTLSRSKGSRLIGFKAPDKVRGHAISPDGGLDPQEQTSSRPNASVDFPARHTIHESGGDADSVFQIVNGYVQLSIPTLGSANQIVAILGKGDYFGFSADGHHLCKARTLTPVTARKVACSSDNATRTDLISINRRLQSQINAALWHHVSLAHLSVLERLADFLLWWARRHAPKLAISADSGPLDLHIPLQRRDIANHLAMTSETMSRMLGELQRRGMITMTTRKSPIIRITDLPALVALCPKCREGMTRHDRELRSA